MNVCDSDCVYMFMECGEVAGWRWEGGQRVEKVGGWTVERNEKLFRFLNESWESRKSLATKAEAN